MRKRKKVVKHDYQVFLVHDGFDDVDEVFVRQASCADEAKAVGALAMLAEYGSGWHVIDAIPFKARVT